MLIVVRLKKESHHVSAQRRLIEKKLRREGKAPRSHRRRHLSLSDWNIDEVPNLRQKSLLGLKHAHTDQVPDAPQCCTCLGRGVILCFVPIQLRFQRFALLANALRFEHSCVKQFRLSLP
jgi:hypothetical protein